MRKWVYLPTMVLASLLTACAAPPVTTTSASSPVTTAVSTTNVQAEEAVFAAKTAYLVALKGMSTYQDWPKCTGTSTVLCRNDAVFAQMQKAGKVTSAALDAAEAAVRTPSVGNTARDHAVQAAQAALAALSSLTNNFGVPK